jgi:hypothetical protein
MHANTNARAGTRTFTRTRTPHAHMRTCSHTRTRAHPNARAHTQLFPALMEVWLHVAAGTPAGGDGGSGGGSGGPRATVWLSRKAHRRPAMAALRRFEVDRIDMRAWMDAWIDGCLDRDIYIYIRLDR